MYAVVPRWLAVQCAFASPRSCLDARASPPLAVEHTTFDIIDFLAAPRRDPAGVACHPTSKRPRLAQVVFIWTAHRRWTVIRTALDHSFAPWQPNNQHAVGKQRVEQREQR